MTYEELQQTPTGTPLTFVSDLCKGTQVVHVRHDVDKIMWYNRGLQAVSKRPSGPYFFCVPYTSLSVQA